MVYAVGKVAIKAKSEKRVNLNFSTPLQLIGRSLEFNVLLKYLLKMVTC